MRVAEQAVIVDEEEARGALRRPSLRKLDRGPIRQTWNHALRPDIYCFLPKLRSLDLAVHTRTGRAGLLEYCVEEHAVFKELGEAGDGQRSSERPRWHHHWHHGYNPACPSSGPR